MKKWGCLILLVGLLQCAVMTLASENGEIRGGTWILDDNGILTISGPADLTDWYAYSTSDFRQKEIRKVIYGPEVRNIPPGAFSYSHWLTEFVVDDNNPDYCTIDGVIYSKDQSELIESPTAKTGSLVLPEGVKVIRESAFIGSYLTELILPESLEMVEAQAFMYARFIKLHIPAHVTKIEPSALNISDVTEFTVSEDNSSYCAKDGVLFSKDGKTLIHYCVGSTIETYVFPADVETVGLDAFFGADYIQKLEIVEGVFTIGGGAFNSCQFTEICLPATLKRIEESCFHGTDALQTVNYSGTAEQWKEIVIENSNEELLKCVIHCTDEDIVPEPIEGTIGEGITYVLDLMTGELMVSGEGQWQEWAFDSNGAIRSVVLEEGVSEIGRGAFYYCKNLEKVVIPSTVTCICYEAFYCCQKLTEVTIPESVLVLEDELFDGCSSLETICYEGTMEQWKALTENTSNSGLSRIDIECSDGTVKGQKEQQVSTDGLQAFVPGELSRGAFYIIPDTSLDYAGFDTPYMSPVVLRYNLLVDADSYRSQDPEGPVWALTQTKGTAEADTITWGTNLEGDVWLKELPVEPETDEWHLECTWAGERWEHDFQIRFENTPSLPTGVESVCGEHWILRSGDPIEIRDAFRFVDGWRLPGEDITWTLGSDRDDFWSVGTTVENGRLKACTPGVYPVIIELKSANISWRFKSFLYITDENGEIHNYVSQVSPEKTLKLPEDLRSIEEEAFANTSSERVEIPEGCTYIGDRAFAESCLREIVIPESVESISESAFADCSNLVLIGDSLCVHDYAEAMGMVVVSVD